MDHSDNLYLMHHGVKGQKWGVRRYQNPDGTLTAEGRKKVIEKYEKRGAAIGSTAGKSILKGLIAVPFLYTR